MPINELSVTGLRNLEPVTLHFSPRINILYGDNGSGKSSLLEAIYCLSLARSFRSTKIQTLIQHSATETLVFAKLAADAARSANKIGIRRSRQGEFEIRINEESIKTIAQLARALPLQLLNSDSFLLLEGAPKFRRQFLDWGVFHVEHSFHSQWGRMQASLKQRNSWLRHAIMDKQLLASWDKEFCTASESIDQARQQYIAQLKPIFEQTLDSLIKLPELTISYYRGWDRDNNLQSVLDSSLERDRVLGYTQAGPQRADIRIKVDGHNAIEVLSRGQQKLVVCALKLAQGYLLAQQMQQQCIYLIDDLPAELDQEHRKALSRLLEELNCQAFITGTDKETLLEGWQMDTPVAMFHVEHGRIKLVE